ncbi:MAG: hypothetical protein ACTS2F_21450 [Thainema sp.]
MNTDFIIDYLQTNNISKAKIIRYSGDMARRVIIKLPEKNTKVELLLQHPHNAVNLDQLGKIALFHPGATTDFGNLQNLSVKYYSELASLRGVKLDDKILLMG